jgi:hypothetical protein
MTGAAAACLVGATGQSSFGVSTSPSDVSGFGNSGSAANITTALTVATPSGGVSPYTYSWVQTGVSPYTWTIGSPSAASTSFTCSSLGPGVTADATFRVTVTDAVGSTAQGQVSAFANNGQPYDSRLDRGDTRSTA